MPFSNNHSIDLSKFKYRIELHTHTKHVSMCSGYDARKLVQKYHELGFDGIAITNHYDQNRLDLYPDGKKYAEFYESGYLEALEEGKKLGVKVYLGAEICFRHTYNDILVFGIDRNDLAEMYRYMDTDPKTMLENVKNDRRLLIQAHPFRKNIERLPSDIISGFEVENISPGHNSQPGNSYKHAKENPDYIITPGSDCHVPKDAGLASIMAETLPNDSFELADLLRSKRFIFNICGSIRIPYSFNYEG